MSVLEEVEALRAEREKKATENTAIVNFEKPLPEVISQPKKINEVDEVVEKVFTEAVLHEVKTDEGVQTGILDTAKHHIQTKMGVLKSNVDKEGKEAHFNNHADACTCYGYDEKTVAKWAVNAMSFWYSILTGIWIVIASVTFMPIVFIGKKINVAVKHMWLCIVLAIIVYAAIVTAPWWASLLAKGGG